jgi:hypothetical protein
MPAKVTYKDLYLLVNEEIAKSKEYQSTSTYSNQLSRTDVQTLGFGSSPSTDINLSSLITAMQTLLAESLNPVITEGLTIVATSPATDYVTISAGKGSVGGRLYTLEAAVSLPVPFDSSTSVFFVNLYQNRITIEPNQDSVKLTIAKVEVPNPGVTNRVIDKRDGSWDAYIVNYQQVNLYADPWGKFEEDTIEVLRANISPILSDNLIGNIRLSENLKITNTQGTLELNSDSLKLFDINENLLSKFNRNGVYFYDTDGIELAKFTGSEARVGNIRVLTNALQSSNFLTGNTGFQIKDDGTAEFNIATIRGTLYATTGEIGGWTITNSSIYATTTGTIKTSANVGSGYNGVILDKDGLRAYDDVLGIVVNLPSDGSAPSFSSGVIQNTTFEINTNAVLRTSSTVGDGTSSSAGILINNTGLYGCGASQTLSTANLKALIDGTISLSGTINSSSGSIGGVTISSTKLSGGLIEGSNIRSAIIETSASAPKIRIDTAGLYYQATDSVGKYNTFKYGDGTKYGSGVTAFLFKASTPILSVEAESIYGDVRLYNRSADPASGTHKVGTLICVSGKLKICTTAGSPGTFAICGTQS